MDPDRLSEVLELIEVRSVVTGGSAVRGLWRTSSEIDDDLKFIAVVRGSARLSTDGLEGWLHLAEGDVAVLNGRTRLALEGGDEEKRGHGDERVDGVGERRIVEPPSAGSVIDATDSSAEDADVIVGGRIELNSTGRQLLLQALPPVAHIGEGNPITADVRGHVHRLFAEMVAGRVGATFAIRHYGQLLVLDVVRGFMNDPNMPPGWLKVLADERLRPALALIHEQPAQGWSLEDLARAAAMSRSSFAQRFRAVAGMPPLAYLINWRMALAQRELRLGDARVGALASTLGYASESAFSSAFKREVGESPLAYRTRFRPAV